MSTTQGITASSQESLIIQAVHKQLDSQIQEIVNEEAAHAAKRVEQRIKQEAVSISSKLLGWTRFELNRYELNITIKIPQTNEDAT